MKKILWDSSGAFGDIGVFLPLAVALIAKNDMNPTALFLMAGMFYLASAVYFKITMPVQPLKAMSAIAVASGLGYGVINAAGITVATEATGKLLYAGRAERLTLKSIPLSMGLANILSGFAGGAPMCHGCGGLTAHNTFGAKDHRSGYIIGSVLIVFAIFSGESAVALISAFPSGILGVLLCYVGIQHSLFIRDILNDTKAVLVAFTVGILGFAFNNLTIGFLAGLTVHYGAAGLKKIARA